jgi:hypothetical protein
MPRRRFLQRAVLFAGGATAVAVVAATAKFRPLIDGLAGAVWGPAARIRSHFAYLALDSAGVADYVRDYEQFVGPLSRLSAWPGTVYTNYLLSTDFFSHGADQSRPVRYIAFYQPGVSICVNPLATFD